jgi:hypothetical protein
MEAVLEKPKVKRVVIEEDTDLQVVRFMNQEQKGIPLEFSAGAPISQNIRNYVLKDGLCYNLPKRLRDHVTGLKYPIYKDVDDPDSPVQGVKTSKIVGYQYRFVLMPVSDPKIAVYEHLREKLNQKVMPGALENSPRLDTANIQSSGNIMTEKKQTELMTENEKMANHNSKLVETIKDMTFTLNKVRGELKEVKEVQAKVNTGDKKVGLKQG